MHSSILNRTVLFVACSASAAAGCDEFKLPEAPDMSDLVREYEQPTGRLDAGNVQAMSTALLARAEEVRAHAPLELTNALVSNAQAVGDSDASTDAGTQAGEQRVRGNRIDVGAAARLYHVCRGWEGSDSLSEENGTADLTLTVDQSGMIPTAWGRLERCRVQKGDLALEFEGDIRLHFGDNERRVGFRALRRVSYLFSFEGSLVVGRDDDRTTIEGELNFRVFPSGVIQISVGLPDATNVVGEFEPGIFESEQLEPALRAGLLTRDVDWSCEVRSAQPSGSCASKADSATVIQW